MIHAGKAIRIYTMCDSMEHPKQFELKNGLILTSSIKSLLTNQFI